MKLRDEDPDRPWHEPGVYQLGSGIFRIPLSMPHDGLLAVNVYALESRGSLHLIDAGPAAAASRTSLIDSLGILGFQLRDIESVYVTHLHYDHLSQAVRLRQHYEVPFSLGEGERPAIEGLLDGTIEPLHRQLSLLHLHGAQEVAADVGTMAEVFAGTDYPIEVADTWLRDDVELALPGRTLLVTHTPGHTRGHVVFRDDASDVLFSGDHVLSHITPSIGFDPSPSGYPLVDYLRSLTRVRAMPDARLLPAHGPTTDSSHRRIDELIEHHERRLFLARAAVTAGSSTAYDVARRLPWTRRNRRLAALDPFNRMLAVLETAAHLDLDVCSGVLLVESDGEIRRYRVA